MRKLLTITLITLTLFLTSPLSHPQADTKESDAVNKITKGNFPELEDIRREQSFWEQATEFLANIFSGNILFQMPEDKDRMYVQAKQDAAAYVPQEILPKEEGKELFTGSLGKNTGIYGVEFPLLVTDSDEISRYECTYERAQFPEDVHPIVPGPESCE